MTALPTLAGDTFSAALGINDKGQVVGLSYNDPGLASRAVLWEKGTMTDLNTLIPVGSNWTLRNASGINKDGYIVGGGTNPDGLLRAFLFNSAAK